MKNIKGLCFLWIVGLIMVSCDNKSKFLIKKGQVGKVNSKTEVQEIEKLFPYDSIATRLSEGEVGYLGAMTQDEDLYMIYDDQEHLLTLVENPLDSHL